MVQFINKIFLKIKLSAPPPRRRGGGGRRTRWAGAALVTARAAASQDEAEPVGRQGIEFFESRVRPLPARECASCHATILHLLGFDPERMTYRPAGRDFRLAGERGRVVREIPA
jgi:hypothetical protein